jgi:hypothetical protein
MNRILIYVVAGGALLAAACGQARVVQRSQTGGVIALEGNRQKALEQAQQMMAEHCRGPYTVVEEGEHVVGSVREGGEETFVAEDGTLVTHQGETTRDATEWRLTYVCGQGGPPPPQHGPGPEDYPPDDPYDDPYDAPPGY